jgi:hypothetical protein
MRTLNPTAPLCTIVQNWAPNRLFPSPPSPPPARAPNPAKARQTVPNRSNAPHARTPAQNEPTAHPLATPLSHVCQISKRTHRPVAPPPSAGREPGALRG